MRPDRLVHDKLDTMRTVDRLDRFQRKHPVVGYPIAVIYKFFDDQGAYLAALITYYGFLSIFPLLLLLTSALGFVMESNSVLREQIVNSALRQIPVIGEELQTPKGLQGSTFAVVTGSLLALYGGIGVAQAIQNMSNTCWNVPRNHRPNPILARLRSAGVVLFLGAGLLFIGWLPYRWTFLDGWLGLALNVVVGSGLFLLLMKMTTAREQGWGRLLPGAVFVSVVWQLFSKLAPTFVDTFLAKSSATYGTLGTGLSLLIAGYIMAIALVFGTEMNVVLRRRLYPRALLTPFTDAVELTFADHRAYSALAHTQRLKGYEFIDVVFDKDGDGVADAPSDLLTRWDEVYADHLAHQRNRHPARPRHMWHLPGQQDDEPGDNGSTAIRDVSDGDGVAWADETRSDATGGHESGSHDATNASTAATQPLPTADQRRRVRDRGHRRSTESENDDERRHTVGRSPDTFEADDTR